MSTEIYKIGSRVKIGPDDDPIDATIIAAMIRADGVSYEAAWWDGKSRYTAWVRGEEIAADTPKTTVGFTVNGR